MHIHVIHENAAWLEPLADALNRQGLPWRDWFLDRGVFDLSRPPPQGVFYNRMRASSPTRAHRPPPDLKTSRARQCAALEAAGIRTPDTVLVAGKELLVAAAQQHFAAGAF